MKCGISGRTGKQIKALYGSLTHKSMHTKQVGIRRQDNKGTQEEPRAKATSKEEFLASPEVPIQAVVLKSTTYDRQNQQ